jgi:hypothetical protein
MTRSALFIGVAAAAAATQLIACTGDLNGTTTSTMEDVPSFEEFEAATYLEDFEGGVYIVNGDTPIVDIKALEEFYHSVYDKGSGLIVHRSGTLDAKWNDTQKLNLTYCISNSFGSNKTKVVQAMEAATTNGWEQVANVNFVYASAQDGSCTATNNNVVFDIRPVSGQPYLARAFFPNQGRSSRNVLIDSSALGNIGGGWTLAGVLAHELGHALGFRHEHTRPEAGQCYEDNSWRPLTPYDSTSVMHYPQCGGTGPALTISALDEQGAQALYGAPGGGGGGGGGEDPPPPPPPPTGGTPKTGSASGSLTVNQWRSYQALSVVPGTRFTVNMTGSGDPDLYLRFGSAPNFNDFHCRPYLDGATESCSVDVPAGLTTAHLAVHGYTAASYTINVSWTAP